MSRYLYEDALLGFLINNERESLEEISDSYWIPTDDGEELKEEILLCKTSFKEKMDDRPFSSAFASYFVSKTKTWQTTPFANNAVRAAAHNVKFHNKVHDRQGLQNLSAQILVILSFYFLILLLKKPNHKETTIYDSSWKPYMVAHG